MSTKRNRNLPQQLTLDHVSPATRLLEKRRHMFEVQEALDAQKEEFQRREATFKRREEMLKQKDLALQESLIKFNKFLQENDSKRNRAEKKRVDEAKQKQGKEAEIVKLLVEVERQKEKRAQMEAEVHKMSQYQAYLEGVLEVEEEYPEIVDLLSRYETLDAAHEDLVQRQHLAGRENEEERHNLQTFIRERTDEILGYNNKIAELQQQSEKTSESAIEKQDEADRQMAVVAERTLQLGQVREHAHRTASPPNPPPPPPPPPRRADPRGTLCVCRRHISASLAAPRRVSSSLSHVSIALSGTGQPLSPRKNIFQRWHPLFISRRRF